MSNFVVEYETTRERVRARLVNFPTGVRYPQQQHKDWMRRNVVSALRRPETELFLEGVASRLGSSGRNLTLSRNRALAVLAFLREETGRSALDFRPVQAYGEHRSAIAGVRDGDDDAYYRAVVLEVLTNRPRSERRSERERHEVEGSREIITRATETILRGFPPHPIPRVSDEGVQYEYMNRLNGYRDTIHAYEENAADRIPRLREWATDTPRHVGAPGFMQGSREAERRWHSISRHDRDFFRDHPNAVVPFEFTSPRGLRVSVELTVHKYFGTRLDYLIAETITLMTRGAQLSGKLREVRDLVYLAPERLGSYSPPTYLSHFGQRNELP